MTLVNFHKNVIQNNSHESSDVVTVTNFHYKNNQRHAETSYHQFGAFFDLDKSVTSQFRKLKFCICIIKTKHYNYTKATIKFFKLFNVELLETHAMVHDIIFIIQQSIRKMCLLQNSLHQDHDTPSEWLRKNNSERHFARFCNLLAYLHIYISKQRSKVKSS